MKFEDTPLGMTGCMRCGGCGYGDYPVDHPYHCADCAEYVIAVKRPGCRLCGGTGIMACTINHVHGAETPCGLGIEKDGELCHQCDLPVEGDDGCQRGCWQPINTIADGKAVFADLGFDTEIVKRGDRDA